MTCVSNLWNCNFYFLEGPQYYYVADDNEIKNSLNVITSM
jgi:hypothetical protein